MSDSTPVHTAGGDGRPSSGNGNQKAKVSRKRASDEPVGADRCFKCRSGKSFAASRDGAKKPYCKDCMSTYLEKVVRDGFFRSCGVPSDTKVAVCCSGGASSLMLLNVLGMIAQENKQRGGDGRINFDLHVLVVDETGVIDATGPHATNGAAKTRYENVSSVAARWGLPMLVPTGDGEGTSFGVPMRAAISAEVRDALNGRLSLTDREELYLLARQRVLGEAAAGFGCKGIITGENAIVAATRGLAAVVRGRGAHCADEAGFRGHLWTTKDKAPVTVFRPLRTVLPKEVVVYAMAQNLPKGMYNAAPCTGTSLRSLNRSLESFMATLMIQFRSTVFNVLTTIEKMHSARPGGDTFTALVGNASGGVVVASSRAKTVRAPPPTIDTSATLSTTACSWCGLCIEVELDPAVLTESGVPSSLTTSFKGQPSSTAGAGEHGRHLCYGCMKLEYELPRVIQAELPGFSSADLAPLFPPPPVESSGCDDCDPESLRAMTDAEKKDAVAEFLLNDDDAE